MKKTKSMKNCKLSRPLDFHDYWDNAISQLGTISPDFKMTYSDSLSTASKKAYIVEMQSVENLTIRAYYFVPRKEDPHYAVLHLPGYGTGFEDATALFDDDCPPQVGFAAYNDITSGKEYIIYPKDGHLGESNYYDYFMKWFDTLFTPSED